MGVSQRRPHRFDGLTAEHRAHRFNSHGNNERNRSSDFFGQLLDGQDGRFDVARVLAGLDQQQVYPAFQEAFCLDVVGVLQSLKGHSTRYGDRLCGGAHGASNKAWLPRP